MKIGILTFHSQLNYGGVLQCWALQTALNKMGHEAVVIDRWLSNDNFMLERGYDKWSIKQWIKFWIRSLLGLGDINAWLRVWRTKKFLQRWLKLTPYHFVDWADAPKDLGVEMLVVGSDQVWHCGDWGEPAVYLLEGAPKISAIAYAASFGLTDIPADFQELYKRGLPKFQAISCREAEGAEICRKLGAEATHVVDPTLLLEATNWQGLAGKRKTRKTKRLVCYLLSIEFAEVLADLNKFAEATGGQVEIYLDQWCYKDILPLPTNIEKAKRVIGSIKERWCGRVQVIDSAGPIEFVKAMASADWVVSDSFHALMFAIINNCNARIIRPHSKLRQKMFARIEEFAAHTEGPLIADSVPDALDSLARGEEVRYDYDWLAQRVEYSKKWVRFNARI